MTTSLNIVGEIAELASDTVFMELFLSGYLIVCVNDFFPFKPGSQSDRVLKCFTYLQKYLSRDLKYTHTKSKQT